MANSLITPDMIAQEGLMQLENNLVMANQVHRDYKKEFTGGQGATVDIRKPVKFYTADGATRVNQDVEEKNTSITIDQRKHVSWGFSTQDLTLSVEEYSERYIKPACITLANTVDRTLHGLYNKVYNNVGTPGTTPADYAAIAGAAQRLDEMAVLSDSRSMVMDPAAGYAIGGNQLTLDSIGQKGKTAYEEAEIGRIAKFSTYGTQNVQNHTTGTHATGSTPLVNGGSQAVTYANASGANTQTLITDGWANSTAVLTAGDTFTIAGVFAVNPVPGEGAANKTVMTYLQQFVVINAATSSGAGAATLTISPAIVVTGPQQTVSAVPADNAAITVMGTEGTAYPQNLGFHKNAFALVTVPLEMPDGAAFKSRKSHNGLSLRVVKDYDIDADTDIIRMDILYGVKAIYPDLAARLWG